MRFWLDDERPAPPEFGPGQLGRHYETSQSLIKEFRRLRFLGLEQFKDEYHYLKPPYLQEISLDHDLGGEDTGMKVLDYMVRMGIWPAELTIHTANPPARDDMLRYANRYAPEWVEISVRTW